MFESSGLSELGEILGLALVSFVGSIAVKYVWARDT
jgi:hypothetical protein